MQDLITFDDNTEEQVNISIKINLIISRLDTAYRRSIYQENLPMTLKESKVNIQSRRY